MTSIPLYVRYVQLKPIHGTPVVVSMAKLINVTQWTHWQPLCRKVRSTG